MLGHLVAMLAGIKEVVAMVLDHLTLCMVVAVAGSRGGACLRSFHMVPVVVVAVQLRHLVYLYRCLRRVFDVDVDDTGAKHWGHKEQYQQYKALMEAICQLTLGD